MYKTKKYIVSVSWTMCKQIEVYASSEVSARNQALATGTEDGINLTHSNK